MDYYYFRQSLFKQFTFERITKRNFDHRKLPLLILRVAHYILFTVTKVAVPRDNPRSLELFFSPITWESLGAELSEESIRVTRQVGDSFVRNA